MSSMRVTGFSIAFLLGIAALAQTEAVFRTRLSPVAMDATMRATVTGSGNVTARLTGSKLVVSGSFEGLLSNASLAQVHRSPVTGVRGPAILDLTVTKAPGGTLSGSFDLSPEQLESLRAGKLYVQLHSDKAPEGNLWGWLLP
ncbi:MAG TPA: CHRD domain-containing protein [Bryobacteraceae bacterium]|nr:CHRD domain-containing protein [Bryobacteraceae bacterium]